MEEDRGGIAVLMGLYELKSFILESATLAWEFPLILLTSPPFCQTRGQTLMFQMCHFHTGIFKAEICLQNSG